MWCVNAKARNLFVNDDVNPIALSRRMLLHLINQNAGRIVKLPLALDGNAAGTGEMKLNLVLPQSNLIELHADKLLQRKIKWNAIHKPSNVQNSATPDD